MSANLAEENHQRIKALEKELTERDANWLQTVFDQIGHITDLDAKIIAKLEAEIDKLRDQNDELEAKVAAFKEQNSKDTIERKVNQRIAELEETIAELEADNMEHTETLNELQDILRTLTNSRTALTTSSRELVKQWDAQGRRITELKKRITELEGALEDISAYATIETPTAVMEIINGVLKKEA